MVGGKIYAYQQPQGKAYSRCTKGTKVKPKHTTESHETTSE